MFDIVYDRLLGVSLQNLIIPSRDTEETISDLRRVLEVASQVGL